MFNIDGGCRHWVGAWRHHGRTRSRERGSRRRRATHALAFTLAGAALLVAAPPARAGTFTAYLCQGPSLVLVGAAGLQEQLLNEAQFVSGEDACISAGQQVTLQLGPDANGYSNLQGGLYEYSTPSGMSISSYSLLLSAYAAPCSLASGRCPGGVGQVFVTHTGQSDPHYDYRDLGAGAANPTTVTASGLLGVGYVLIGATCDGGCPSPQTIASLAIADGRFVLVDATVPKVTATAGPSEGSVLSGEAEWDLTASDVGGSGIYRVVDSVDGKAIGAHVLDENGGLCNNLGGEAERAFASPQPCPSEAGGSVALDTNDVSDGEHAVHISVETAAGDAADVFDGRVTTANGPVIVEAPEIQGTAQVGTVLSATNGAFGLRPEQEWAGPVSGQWESCVTSSSCEPIKGATSATYTPTAADAGHELMYVTTASAKVTDAAARGLIHTTSADSIQTLAVKEPNGSGGGCSSSCPAPGNGGNGGSGGGGGNGSSGTGAGSNGSTGASAGSGLTVSLAGLAPPSVAGPVLFGGADPWHLSLSVSPRRVRRRTRIRLSGRIQTAPRPAAGKLVYLQARGVHAHVTRVTGRPRTLATYGRWVTFMALRANPSGAFSTTYRFRLGGRHVYQFRAVAPAEGQFRNPTGSSRVVSVHET